jgi:predicted DNA-binding transcriptional regulator AlpA
MDFNIVPENDITNKFLTKEELSEIVPFHHATIRRMVKKGIFPAPVKVSGTLFWNGNAVMKFLLEMAKESSYVPSLSA